MKLRNAWRKVAAFGISTLLFILLALPAYADNASSGTTLDIRLKVGSGQMTVNGEAVKVQAPYQKNGATFVPLSVLTKTFGASLQLQNNKIITLTQGSHKVVLTIGSKTEKVDGKSVTLSAAPEIVKGYTMVPIRVLEAFGAKVGYNSSTKEVHITGDKYVSPSASAGGIDTDAGKSKIGDSFFKWSMNYPTGLAQTYQSTSGDSITFEDVKQDFYLAIDVSEQPDSMDADEQLDLLKDYMYDDETILDTKPVKLAGGTFQRLVTKSSDGYYYEYRGIQANQNFYMLTISKQAKSLSEFASAAAKLLDSFRPEFDANNASLKDLTRIHDGSVTFEDESYGLRLDLPYGWEKDEYGYYDNADDSGLGFYNDSSTLRITVHSLQPGDTLTDWMNRYVQSFKNEYVASVRTEPTVNDIVWNGVPAKLLSYTLRIGSGKPVQENDIMAVSGSYKFLVELGTLSEQTNANDAVLKRLTDGLKIDFGQVERSFGDIPDPLDTISSTAVVTKSSKDYGFSFSVPKRWKLEDSSDTEAGFFIFTGPGILFSTYAIDDPGMSVAELIDSQLEFLEMEDMELVDRTPVTIDGAQGYRISLRETGATNGLSDIEKFNIVEKNGTVYMIGGSLAGENQTDFNLKQFDDAINSLSLD